MLLFGGLRISEQLAMVCDDVQLGETFAFVPDSKNGEPQPVHLTPTMIQALEAHPRSIKRPGQRLFRFHKGGGLDFMLIRACAIASGIEPPRRVKRGSKWPKLPPYEFDWVTWHTFRRTYATWMRRYGDLDDKDLVDTHRWKTIESASRYAQTVVHEAARRANLLPIRAGLHQLWTVAEPSPKLSPVLFVLRSCALATILAACARSCGLFHAVEFTAT
jgi:integrase